MEDVLGAILMQSTRKKNDNSSNIKMQLSDHVDAHNLTTHITSCDHITNTLARQAIDSSANHSGQVLTNEYSGAAERQRAYVDTVR